jgi:predicted DNA binding CopG/RHH family protein
MDTLKVPEFQDEAEEAKWLDENREGLAAAFLVAAQKGEVRQGTLKQRGAIAPTTIRLAPEEIARARALAERKGLRYQTYLKMLIHEALEREEKAS